MIRPLTVRRYVPAWAEWPSDTFSHGMVVGGGLGLLYRSISSLQTK